VPPQYKWASTFFLSIYDFFRHLLTSEINATPEKPRLPRTGFQSGTTTSAMMPAGKINSRTLTIKMIMTMPTISRRKSRRIPYKSGMSKGKSKIGKKSQQSNAQKRYFNLADNNR